MHMEMKLADLLTPFLRLYGEPNINEGFFCLIFNQFLIYGHEIMIVINDDSHFQSACFLEGHFLLILILIKTFREIQSIFY